MQKTAEFTHTAYGLSGTASNDRFNFRIAIEISADEITPIAFSKTHFFQTPRYGLFVQIERSSVVYTIRKNCKNGFADIIEQDSCFEAIQDIWATIYENA